MSATYLKTDRELEELCRQARDEGRIGLDTEFHRERRYTPKLALVQLAVEGREVLLDPFGEADLGPLDELVADASVVKVLHAASQDLEIFFGRSRQVPRNVFDTQIAAAMLGMGAQISLLGLVESLLGIRLSKGATFTDWLERPLSTRQEDYALADVEHLLEMHDELARRLDELGRTGWLAEELRRFERESYYEIPPEELYTRVKRFSSLRSRGLAVLSALAIWREDAARAQNRPRRSIVADEVLVELARSTPDSVKELGRTRGLHPGEIKRSGTDIVAAIERGLATPDDQCPVLVRDRAVPREMELAVSFVQSFLKIYCSKVGIDPILMASGADIESLVSAHLQGRIDVDRHPVLQGWRGELVGNRVLAFLRGEIGVRLDPKSVMPILDDVG